MPAINSQGSIRALNKPEKTCRKWELQVSLGYYDPVKKCYPKRRRTVYGTKREAEKELRDFIAELESGVPNMDANMMFPMLADLWLGEREGTVSNGTMRKNEGQIKGLNVYLADYRVKDIDLSVVRTTFTKLSKEGGRTGKPLSGTTCQGMFATLSLILDFAKYKKLIEENPCKLIDRKSRPKVDTREKEALTVEQVQGLGHEIYEGEPTGHKMGLMLAIACGLCREEFLALQWRDVDFEQKCIRVEKANTADDADLVGTKNEYRRRILPMEDEELDRLAEWRDVQWRKLAAKGIVASEFTFIVSNPVGEHLHPEAYGKWWRRNREDMGLSGIGLHQLRHTFATILCSKDVDMITAFKLMGHRDFTMLSRVYAHMVPENARRAVGAVSGVLRGKQEVTYAPFA